MMEPIAETWAEQECRKCALTADMTGPALWAEEVLEEVNEYVSYLSLLRD